MRSAYFVVFSLAALGSTGLVGCASQPDEQLESIRQALPRKEPMQLSGPETNAATGTGNSSDAGAAPANAPYATYYTFTRTVRDGVNKVTADVLGMVWFIVHTTPTSVGNDAASWGPYTDALSPATWRFRVTHQGGQQYAYVLEGRPKQSSSTRTIARSLAA